MVSLERHESGTVLKLTERPEEHHQPWEACRLLRPPVGPYLGDKLGEVRRSNLRAILTWRSTDLNAPQPGGERRVREEGVIGSKKGLTLYIVSISHESFGAGRRVLPVPMVWRRGGCSVSLGVQKWLR